MSPGFSRAMAELAKGMHHVVRTMGCHIEELPAPQTRRHPAIPLATGAGDVLMRVGLDDETKDEALTQMVDDSGGSPEECRPRGGRRRLAWFGLRAGTGRGLAR